MPLTAATWTLKLWMRKLECEEALLSHMSGWILEFLCFSESPFTALLLVHAFCAVSRLEHTSFLLGVSFASVHPTVGSGRWRACDEIAICIFACGISYGREQHR